MTVDADSGSFTGPLAGKDRLAPDARYALRVRAVEGDDPDRGWSGWRLAFRTVGEQEIVL